MSEYRIKFESTLAIPHNALFSFLENTSLESPERRKLLCQWTGHGHQGSLISPRFDGNPHRSTLYSLLRINLPAALLINGGEKTVHGQNHRPRCMNCLCHATRRRKHANTELRMRCKLLSFPSTSPCITTPGERGGIFRWFSFLGCSCRLRWRPLLYARVVGGG